MGLHDKDTARITFNDGSWVDIRKKITAGARRDAMNRAVTARFDAKGTVDGSFATGDFKLGLLYRMIVAWSDEEPVTEAAIDDLPEEITDRLLEEIDHLNQGRTEAAAAPLDNSSIDA